jgi:hypothetical protein
MDLLNKKIEVQNYSCVKDIQKQPTIKKKTNSKPKTKNVRHDYPPKQQD